MRCAIFEFPDFPLYFYLWPALHPRPILPTMLFFAVMSLLISHVESSTEAEWKGYLYAVFMLAVLVTQSLTNAYSSQIMYILGMNVKTAVTAAVYRWGNDKGTQS